MRELVPGDAEVDPLDRYAADGRRPHPDGRPWLVLNMVATLDGATAIGGLSGPIGGAGDRRVFGAIRAVADVILVAGGTVRAERYGPPGAGARLAVVSASLGLDPGGRLFTDARPGCRPWLVTTASADPAGLAELVDDVIVAGEERVDVRRAVHELGQRGAQVVLCEGGPSLNGQLIAAELVDELCLTVAPLLAGGESARLAHGPAPAVPASMRLERALEEDGALFLRYLRA